jgi:hypothetical protein
MLPRKFRRSGEIETTPLGLRAGPESDKPMRPSVLFCVLYLSGIRVFESARVRLLLMPNS